MSESNLKIAVVGAGEIGRSFVQSVQDFPNIFINIIEKDPSLEPLFAEYSNVRFILGDVTQQGVLTADLCESISYLFALTNSDETNIIACKISQEFGLQHNICRNKIIDFSTRNQKELNKLGIHCSINIADILATECAMLIHAPNSVDHFKFNGGNNLFIGMNIIETSSIIHQSYSTLYKYFCNRQIFPTFWQRNGSTKYFNDDGFVQNGDIIYFMCEASQLQQLRKILKYSKERIKKILIYGINKTTQLFVEKLRYLPWQRYIILVDENREACVQLSEKIDDIVILNFNILDTKIFKQEKLHRVDIFVALDTRTENNIVASLLAKEFHIPHTLCFVNSSDYIDILNRYKLSINAINPFLSATRRFNKFLFGENILTYFPTQSGTTQVFEIIIKEHSSILKYSVKVMNKIPFFKIHAVMRDNNEFYDLLSNQDAIKIFQVDDRLIISTSKENIFSALQYFSLKAK